MSNFYSDLFSWTTAGLALGAIALSDIDIPQPETDAPETDLIVLASVSAERAVPKSEPLPAVIPMAKLETVTFTASGETADGMRSARPSGPMGVVTGRSVNIRSGPGTSHAVVSRAVQNDQLAVTGATDGAWVEVELTLSGELAWIHGKFFRAPQTEVVARN